MKEVKVTEQKFVDKESGRKVVSPMGSLEEALTKKAKLNNKSNPKSGKALLTE